MKYKCCILMYRRICGYKWKIVFLERINIIFFSAYGESVRNTGISTPFEFTQDQLFGIQDLLFTWQEFQEYIDMGFLSIREFPDIQRCVYSATTGHIGMIKKIEQVFYDYKRTHDVWDESAISLLLVSGVLANSIRTSRSFCI